MRVLFLIFLAAVLLLPSDPSQACVGDGCLNVYATPDGALTTTWDFDGRTVPTYCVRCSGGECLYNAIDPGFIHGPAPAPDGFETVADGTTIRLQVVARDAAVTFRLNTVALDVGETGLVGTTPDLHNHPQWQLRLPAGVQGEYSLSFKLITDSPAHENSETFTIFLDAAKSCEDPTPTSTPTATRTPGPLPCVADCSGDGVVSVDEVVSAVGAALGRPDACAAMDFDGDGVVSISDLVAAVHSALYGCVLEPTPTPTQPATLAVIQATIFSPRCAIPTCHNSETGVDLVLESGSSYDELVGVLPYIHVASEAGYLRVDPGRPENSFLLVKLEGPPLSMGSRMPLIEPFLSADEIALIRAWIAAGAEP